MFEGIWRDRLCRPVAGEGARVHGRVCRVAGNRHGAGHCHSYVSRLTTLTPPGVNRGAGRARHDVRGPASADPAVVLCGLRRSSRRQYRHNTDGWSGRRAKSRFKPRADRRCARPDFVPANYFKTLGVALARGAGFDASADQPMSAEPVVILNYQFWKNRLSADPDIVGKTLTMDGIPHVVVGVAPDQFGGHLGFTGWDLFVRSNGIRAFSPAPPPTPRELSRRPLEGVAEHSRPAVACRQR